MKYICIWLIRFYRKFISPLKGEPCCRFVPSCSAYAIEAFQKRGFFIGLILTIWRILRCNPLCEGGYDPVPETGLRYKGSRVIPHPLSDEACCDHQHGEPCREDDGEGHSDEPDDENIASCRENDET